MPIAKLPPLETGIAGADLSSTPQYTLLKLHTTVGQYVVASANTDVCFGALYTGGKAGEGISFYPLRNGYTIPLIASQAIATIGTKVAPITDGEIVTSDGGAGDQIIGLTAEVSGADQDVIGVVISKTQI